MAELTADLLAFKNPVEDALSKSSMARLLEIPVLRIQGHC